MLNAIIIMLKCRASIIRRVNKHTFNLACTFRFKGFKSQQVITVYKHIIEYIFIADSVLSMIRFFKDLPKESAAPTSPDSPYQSKSTLTSVSSPHRQPALAMSAKTIYENTAGHDAW